MTEGFLALPGIGMNRRGPIDRTVPRTIGVKMLRRIPAGLPETAWIVNREVLLYAAEIFIPCK
jgi:hypothetical protein